MSNVKENSTPEATNHATRFLVALLFLQVEASLKDRYKASFPDDTCDRPLRRHIGDFYLSAFHAGYYARIRRII